MESIFRVSAIATFYGSICKKQNWKKFVYLFIYFILRVYKHTATSSIFYLFILESQFYVASYANCTLGSDPLTT